MMNKTTEDIFCDLMEVSTEMRSAALAEVSGISEEQRQAIRRMLDEAVEAEAYFSGTSVAVKMLPLSSHVEGEGDLCGPYKLLRKLGEGGFGIVWLAEQSVPLRRTVAVKVIKAGMDSAEVLARFEAEKQALAKMDHPHIAKVLDAGVTELGRPYFVMELVEGASITRYCRAHDVGIEQRLQFFTQVCEAVGHAHQKGIIHRDIKPSNVIVTQVDDKPTVKVIDFGIAKAIEGNLTDLTLRTREGQWIGTPAYMSPEQADLASGDVDTRSDIYALGVLLYELLTDEAPFDPQALMQAGYEEMRRIIREVEPPRPSERIATAMRDATKQESTAGMPRKLNAKSISAELDWIVIKAMEKAKERRYDSAAALAGDISRYLADEPVEARPPSSFYLLAKFVRRHRQVVFTVVILFVVLLVALGFTLWQATEARNARDLAREQLAKAEIERNAKDVALQDAEAIAALFSEVIKRPSPEIDGRSVTMVTALDAALSKIDEGYIQQPKRRVMLLHVLAETYENLGLMDKSIEIRHKALNILKSMGETSMSIAVDAFEALVFRLGHVGRYHEAAELAGDVFRLRETHFSPNDAAIRKALESQAVNTFRSGNYSKAIQLQERLVRMTQEANLDDPQEVVRQHTKLVDFCRDSGAAEPPAESIRIFNTRPPESFHKSITAENPPGHLAEALKQQEQILAQHELNYGKNSAKTITTRAELAKLLAELQRGKEAIAAQLEVIEQSKVVYGEFHPKTVAAVDQCLELCNQFSYWEQAYHVRKLAAKIRKDTLGLNHFESLCFYGNHIFAQSLIQNSADGVKLGEQYLPQIRQVMGPHSRAYHHYSCNYARCLAFTGRSKEAMNVFAMACPHMSYDTYANFMYASLLIWHKQEEEYEKLRERMLDFWKVRRTTENQYTYQLERNAFICSMLPMRSESQKQEIAATLDKIETIFKSDKYLHTEFEMPTWSRIIHGILHCRLGNFERAMQCFDEAQQIKNPSWSYTIQWEQTMIAIHRPIALHGLGRIEEAKKLFIEKAANIKILNDLHEPMLGLTDASGKEVSAFLAYQQAARLLGIPIQQP